MDVKKVKRVKSVKSVKKVKLSLYIVLPGREGKKMESKKESMENKTRTDRCVFCGAELVFEESRSRVCCKDCWHDPSKHQQPD